MNKMDHSQHSLESHDHSMHHSMHSGASAPPHHGDHGAIMMMTTAATPLIATTENPANIHLHHSALDYDTTTAASHLGHDMMAMGGHVHGGAAATSSSPHTAMHHMMSMSFHFGYDETILFDWWKIDSVGGLLASMLAIFILAILYEGLKYYREYLFWKTYNLLEYRPVTGPQANAESGPTRSQPQTTASPVQYVGEVIHKQPPRMLSKNHIFQTFLHMIQVTLSFLLMLIFMTYNVWLCLAVVFGAAIGYFVFCWKKSVIVDVTEHCH